MNGSNGRGPLPSPEQIRAYWANMRAQAMQAQFAHAQGAAAGRIGQPYAPPELPPAIPQPMPWGNYPFPTGQSASVPPAGWEQQPQRPVEQYRKDQEVIRWGDTSKIELTSNPLASTSKAGGYVLDCQLWRPSVCLIRLSVTTDAITALTASWVCTWNLTIGVGSSSQPKQRQVQIAPVSDPTVDTDLLLQWPVQLLRVQANVTIGALATQSVIVHATAHVSPISNFEGITR